MLWVEKQSSFTLSNKKRNERQIWSFSFLSTQKGQNSYGVLDTRIGLGGHWEEGPATCSHLTSPAFVAGGSSVHSDWQEWQGDVYAEQRQGSAERPVPGQCRLLLIASATPGTQGPCPQWALILSLLVTEDMRTALPYSGSLSVPSILFSAGKLDGPHRPPRAFLIHPKGYGWETTLIPQFFSFFFPNKYLAALYCLLLSKNEKLSSLNRMFKKFNV